MYTIEEAKKYILTHAVRAKCCLQDEQDYVVQIVQLGNSIRLQPACCNHVFTEFYPLTEYGVKMACNAWNNLQIVYKRMDQCDARDQYYAWSMLLGEEQR